MERCTLNTTDLRKWLIHPFSIYICDRALLSGRLSEIDIQLDARSRGTRVFIHSNVA